MHGWMKHEVGVLVLSSVSKGTKQHRSIDYANTVSPWIVYALCHYYWYTIRIERSINFYTALQSAHSHTHTASSLVCSSSNHASMSSAPACKPMFLHAVADSDNELLIEAPAALHCTALHGVLITAAVLR